MKRQIVILSLLTAFCLPAFSQDRVSFLTSGLRSAATAMRLERLDSLPVGVSDMTVGKNRIVVRKGGNGVISHIGIRVFPDAYRTADDTMIFDYVENALLYNTYQLSDNKLRYKDVRFISGNWQTLLDMPESAAFSMNMIDDKAYQLTWSQDGRNIVDMLVPVKYDVLSNTPRNELVRNFIRDLKAFRANGNVRNIDAAALRMVKDGKDTLYVANGRNYLQDNITNATYYRLIGDSDYVPVLSVRYPAQSMANLALLGKTDRCSARIMMTVIGEDGNRESLEVDMDSLIGYAASCGCTAYFGFEMEEEGIMKGSLFLYNKMAGYDHVLSLQCSKKDMGCGSLLFTSRAYLFTPTTNVKNLYSDMLRK